MSFKHIEVEKKWHQYWKENQIYKISNDSDKPKYYVLDMFPYPSGAGLHVGHPLGYIASDIFARYKRMKGFNVLHPMGFDAFGLPAEEYALKTGIHPAVSTQKNMERYREQFDSLGFSYDWSREICTCDPDYYKWTQWIFGLLFQHYYDLEKDKACPISDLVSTFEKNGNTYVRAVHTDESSFTAEQWNAFTEKEKTNILTEYRLAFRKVGYVNWCEELGTVLANDQVKDGYSDRGGHPVEQKAMTQWYLRTTAYAERLLNGLDDIEWSDALKTIQKNWIGRSEGASVHFDIKDYDDKIEVFTTRPDTIFGATYMVLAPEHDLVSKITTKEQQGKIDTYIDYVKSKSEVDRMAEKEVTGEFTGAYAVNPFTNEEIPIWIGEYVLKDYGTGAIMAVPSDDDRDKSFAEKFGLKIIDVVDKSKYPSATLSDKVGIIINSDFLNGMEVPAAITAVCKEIESRGLGEAKINYKLRDANFSRQRYWGEPFPVSYDKDDIPSIIKVEDLPLSLPETDDFKPGKGGKAPLSRLEDWVNLPNGATRETDVMPAVAGSSWYYLRYMDPNNAEAFASEEAVNYWQEVDLYVGGAEHAVAHLMYARFWHKFLYDLGKVPKKEPFKKLINQGMITGISQFSHIIRTAIHSFPNPTDKKTIIKLEKEYSTIYLSRELYEEEYFLCINDDCSNHMSSTRIPIEHSRYLDQQGNCLDLDGIQKYSAWNKEMKQALFITKQGYVIDGKYITFSGKEEPLCFRLYAEVEKMSKSKWNVVNPDLVTNQYGTDNFRMYEMFLGPIEQSKPWNTQGIEGIVKFSRKLWSLFYDEDEKWLVNDSSPSKESLTTLHKTIKKVDGDIQNFSMNTAISAMMVCVNELKKQKCHSKEILQSLIQMIAPFAPFLSEELWNKLGNEGSVHQSDFPNFDESYLKQDDFTYPVCVNGKKRALMTASIEASKDDLEKEALTLDEVKKWLSDKTLIKTIVVPQKMINFVVK